MSARSALLATAGAALVVLLAGCVNDPTTVAHFTSSATVPAPGVVKLEERSRFGSRLYVDVVLYGPQPAVDLFSFRFGIRVGDGGLVRLATQPSYPQDALVAGAGQTISISVVETADPSLIQVDVTKLGGGAGNGLGTESAVVAEIPFDVLTEGTTSLTLVGVGNTPPLALDPTGRAIAAVRFDPESATVRGVLTGGSSY